jgi:DUF1009 family protein
MKDKTTIEKEQLIEEIRKTDEAFIKSLLRYIEALEENLAYQKETVRELREQLERLTSHKEGT